MSVLTIPQSIRILLLLFCTITFAEPQNWRHLLKKGHHGKIYSPPPNPTSAQQPKANGTFNDSSNGTSNSTSVRSSTTQRPLSENTSTATTVENRENYTNNSNGANRHVLGSQNHDTTHNSGSLSENTLDSPLIGQNSTSGKPPALENPKVFTIPVKKLENTNSEDYNVDSSDVAIESWSIDRKGKVDLSTSQAASVNPTPLKINPVPAGGSQIQDPTNHGVTVPAVSTPTERIENSSIPPQGESVENSTVPPHSANVEISSVPNVNNSYKVENVTGNYGTPETRPEAVTPPTPMANSSLTVAPEAIPKQTLDTASDTPAPEVTSENIPSTRKPKRKKNKNKHTAYYNKISAIIEERRRDPHRKGPRTLPPKKLRKH